jgi:hypothetical protein
MAFVGILFIVGVILKPRRSNSAHGKESEQKKVELKLSKEENTTSKNENQHKNALAQNHRNLLELYKAQWDGIRSTHTRNWQIASVFGAAAAATFGGVGLYPTFKIIFLFLGLSFSLTGLLMLNRYRIDFLKAIWTIANIEKEFNWHEKIWFPSEWKLLAEKDLKSFMINRVSEDFKFLSLPKTEYAVFRAYYESLIFVIVSFTTWDLMSDFNLTERIFSYFGKPSMYTTEFKLIISFVVAFTLTFSFVHILLRKDMLKRCER